jgi:apolipoprotein N-acyltransferase
MTQGVKISGTWLPRSGTVVAGAVGILLFPAPNLGVLAWFAFVPLLLLLCAAPTRREAMLRGWLGGLGFIAATLYWLLPNLIYFFPLAVAVVALLYLPWGLLVWAVLRPGPVLAPRRSRPAGPVTEATALATPAADVSDVGDAVGRTHDMDVATAAARADDKIAAFPVPSSASSAAASTSAALPPVAVPRPPGRLGWGRSLLALAAVPSGWVLIETVRSWKPFGGPWALLGTSQWNHPAELGLASVGGAWLLSFAIMLVNTCIVLILTARVPVRAACAGLAALAVAAGPVWFALHPAPPAASTLAVAMVQPGVVHDPQARDEKGVAITRALTGQNIGLVVWGESSGVDELAGNPADQRQIMALSKELGAPIVVNADALMPNNDKEKVSYLYTPDGVQGEYAKTRLVMFGEYIPFSGQLHWLTKLTKAANVNLVPGEGLTVFRAAGMQLGPLICFESAFPDMARSQAERGAQLLVYQSEDSTFQGSWEPAQHASLAAARAAETGRPAVQASLAGVSAAFDAQGRQLAWLSKDAVGSVVAQVPMQTTDTPYDRFGNYVPVACAVLVALSVLAVVRLRLAANPPR